MSKIPLPAKEKADLGLQLAEELGRTPKLSEIVNLETDALLLARYTLDKLIDLEARVIMLENKK